MEIGVVSRIQIPQQLPTLFLFTSFVRIKLPKDGLRATPFFQESNKSAAGFKGKWGSPNRLTIVYPASLFWGSRFSSESALGKLFWIHCFCTKLCWDWWTGKTTRFPGKRFNIFWREIMIYLFSVDRWKIRFGRLPLPEERPKIKICSHVFRCDDLLRGQILHQPPGGVPWTNRRFGVDFAIFCLCLRSSEVILLSNTYFGMLFGNHW